MFEPSEKAGKTTPPDASNYTGLETRHKPLSNYLLRDRKPDTLSGLLQCNMKKKFRAMARNWRGSASYVRRKRRFVIKMLASLALG
jgi:hypothetical protein